jgi:hypothetical protein
MGHEYSKGFENNKFVGEKIAHVWGTKGEEFTEIIDGGPRKLRDVGNIKDLKNFMEQYNLNSFSTKCEIKNEKVRTFTMGDSSICMDDFYKPFNLDFEDPVYFNQWQTDEGTFLVKTQNNKFLVLGTGHDFIIQS